MEAYLVSITTLVVSFACWSSCSHISKMSSPLIGPSGLGMEHHQTPVLSKIHSYQASETIAPIFVQASPLQVAPSNADQHFQWWDGSSPPEIVHSNWYGFNRFTPREARTMGKSYNRKARASFLLGEGSQMQPYTRYKPVPTQTKQYNEDFAIYEVLRELQRNIRPLPQRGHYVEPRIILLDETVGFPQGVLMPINRHQHHNNLQRQSSYRRQQKDLRRLASAPSPVTIKVVPLKITSVDIANALKQMSFIPLSLDFLKTDDKNPGGNVEISFVDKGDEESDLPPPSSHVATPLDKPLGITYAEAQRTERYVNKYQPR